MKRRSPPETIRFGWTFANSYGDIIATRFFPTRTAAIKWYENFYKVNWTWYKRRFRVRLVRAKLTYAFGDKPPTC